MTSFHRRPGRVATAMPRGMLFAALVALSGAVAAQSSTRADQALGLIDRDQCEQAVDLINQGMREAEPRAFYIAGQLFQNGYCLVQNGPRATRLYERGALLGDRPSALLLALMHARGDGVPQSYAMAGRWYAVLRGTKVGSAEPSPESFAKPEAVVQTYIDAVNDLAVVLVDYPREAIEKGVTATVKVRFDPRFARVRLVGSSDNVATGGGGPDRRDFERALLAGYADALRLLPKPPMSVNVDNSVEHEVTFDRKFVAAAKQPSGLAALPRPAT